MATLRRQPKAVSGLLLAGMIATVALIVAPGFAESAEATARVSALGTHNRSEVIAGTAGQVFKVEVDYPPEAPQAPSVQANAAVPCTTATVPPPLDRDLPVPTNTPCPLPSEVPSEAPTITPPNVPLPGTSVVPTPIASLPIPPSVDPSAVPSVDPSAVPSVDPSSVPTVSPSVPNAPLPGASIVPTPVASVPLPDVTPGVPNLPLPGASLLPTPILEQPIPPALPDLNVGPPANFVQITVPANLITLQSGPAYMVGAWSCRNFPGTSRVVCRGGALLPGTSESFVVIGNIIRPAADTTGTWSVSTSDDDGDTLIPALPAFAGDLDTTARVLQVHNVEITAPAGATDHIVTEDQDNIEVRCDVTNSGSAPLTVTPALNGPTVISSTAPADANVAGFGGTASFTFTGVKVGDAGTGALLCDANAPGASGVDGSRDITLNTKVAIGDPAEIVPGDVVQAAFYALSMAASKTGEASVESGLTGSLSFTDGINTFTAALDDPEALAAGTASVTLQFVSTAIPAGLADDEYETTLVLDAIDNNGAVVHLTPTTPDIVVNGSLPLINVTLTAPASRVPSQPPAIFDGGLLTFTGQVTRGGANCTTCTKVSARLLQFDALMGALPDIDVTDAVTLSSTGAIGGTYSGDYDPAATAVRLEVTVMDNASRTSSINLSDLLDVDNVAPFFVRAVTGPGAREIRVTLSEDIGGKTFGPLDFLMSGNLVTHAYRQGRTVTLETLLPLGEDERPQLFFGTMCVDQAFANTPLCSELYDRVGHPVEGGVLVAFDGIDPLAPLLRAVDGDKGDFDGGLRTFYSNDSQTLFTVGRVTVGHTLTITLDDGTDTVIVDKQITIADCVADPDSHGRCVVEVESSPVVFEGEIDVVGYATDAQQTGDWDLSTPATDVAPRNQGPSFRETVVFDFTKPVITDAVWDGAVTVDVTISENVLGRDFGADWLVLATDGGPVQPFQVGTVTGEGNERTLTIDDDAFDAGSWTVVGVVYEYVGPTPAPVAIPDDPSLAGRLLRAINGPDEQYHDRATNLLDSGTPFSCGGSCA